MQSFRSDGMFNHLTLHFSTLRHGLGNGRNLTPPPSRLVYGVSEFTVPTHMFSTLLVSDRYSQDSDVPTLSDAGKVENEGVSCSHLLMSSDEYSPSQIVLVVSEDVEDSNRGGSLQFNHFSCSCFKRDLLVGVGEGEPLFIH